jgi:hypothetical protein
MLVYGDRSERGDPARWLEALAGRLARLAGQKPGLGRHAAFVAALIDAGRLHQAIADADFAAAGADRTTAGAMAIGDLVFRQAEAVRD